MKTTSLLHSMEKYEGGKAGMGEMAGGHKGQTRLDKIV